MATLPAPSYRESRRRVHGGLLEWGEWPFAAPAGIAHDGKHLWALDPEGKRLCAIVRAR